MVEPESNITEEVINSVENCWAVIVPVAVIFVADILLPVISANSTLLPVTAKLLIFWSPVFVPDKFEASIVPDAEILPDAVTLPSISIPEFLLTVNFVSPPCNCTCAASLALELNKSILPLFVNLEYILALSSNSIALLPINLPLTLTSPDAVIFAKETFLPVIDPLMSAAICADEETMFGTLVFKCAAENEPDISEAIWAELETNVLVVVPASKFVSLVEIDELGSTNDPDISEAICADDEIELGAILPSSICDLKVLPTYW